MTADIELLPLPEPLRRLPGWSAIESYARSCVAHHTAAKDAEIEALRADVAWQKRVTSAHAELHREAKERAERLAEALRLIAAPKRQDGTWNRDREACRQIAAEALRDHDQEGKDG